MSTEIDGEELLCGSCDADDGCDERDDVTQMDGDSFDVTHGDGGEKEKHLPKTVETTTYNKPDGNVNTPDARMAEPSSKRSKIITSSACSCEGSIPKSVAVSTTLVAINSVGQVGCGGMEKHVSESSGIVRFQVGDGKGDQSKP